MNAIWAAVSGGPVDGLLLGQWNWAVAVRSFDQ